MNRSTSVGIGGWSGTAGTLHPTGGSSSGFVPQSSSLAEKITPEHIEGVIQTQKLSIDKGFEDNELDRRHMRFGLVAILIFILAMVGILLATGNQELVEPVLVALVLLGGAGAGGRGVSRKAGSRHVRISYLEPLSLTVTAVAKALGISRKTPSELVNGHAGLSRKWPFASAKHLARRHGIECSFR